MTSNLASAYLPLLIIDIGSDNVKFTQPILNTYSISKLLNNEDAIAQNNLDGNLNFIINF